MQTLVDRLDELVIDAEESIKMILKKYSSVQTIEKGTDAEFDMRQYSKSDQQHEQEQEKKNKKLTDKIEQHSRLIHESNNKIESLMTTIDMHQKEMVELKRSYASVAALKTKGKEPERTALYSVLIASKDIKDTEEQVLDKVRNAINAKEGGIAVE